MHVLSQRLFDIFSAPNFLEMEGLANEVPIFIQSYDIVHEDAVHAMIESLCARLQSAGVRVQALDFFEMVLQELEENHILDDLLRDEASFEKVELLETLENYSDPETRLVPRLCRAIKSETQLTLLTGAGRVFPFLHTHTILEWLQSKMSPHPVVIFFPGKYVQEAGGGSQLRLFGSSATPGIPKSYYRALNLEERTL